MLGDRSTRRLKRAYLRSLKKVWYYQKIGFESLAYEEKTRTNEIKRILSERGWEV